MPALGYDSRGVIYIYAAFGRSCCINAVVTGQFPPEGTALFLDRIKQISQVVVVAEGDFQAAAVRHALDMNWGIEALGQGLGGRGFGGNALRFAGGFGDTFFVSGDITLGLADRPTISGDKFQ
jgi:hypothetical protein